MQQFIEFVKEKLEMSLPGKEAQYKLAPDVRKELVEEAMKTHQEPKPSAVLILIYPKNDEPYIVFTQRHAYQGVHSNQVSFPGGKKDLTDESLKSTAIRECKEEIGVRGEDIFIIGSITELYVPPSNFLITPFIGYLEYTPGFILQEEEVKEIIECPVSLLDDHSIVKTKEIKMANGQSFQTPYFDIKGRVVWGATAMILSEFVSLLDNT